TTTNSMADSVWPNHSSASGTQQTLGSKNPAGERRGFANQKRCGSDRHFQIFGGAESHFPAGLDLVLLAPPRGTAHTGGALAYHENAEAGDLHPLALLQVLGDHTDQVFHHLQSLLFGKLVLLRERGRQVSGGDRLTGFGCCGCCCHVISLLVRRMR